MTRRRPSRSLSGLLGEVPDLTRPPQATQTLPVTALRPGSQQPRHHFDEAALADLADSIRTQGILQPLLVRPVEGGHEIVAGERRWRAAQLAGLSEVPVVVRDFDDQAALAAGLIENLQREELGTLDEVEARVRLTALALDCDPDQARARLLRAARDPESPDIPLLEQVFTRVGGITWRGFAQNKLRILNWPPEVLDALRAGLPYTLGAVIAAAPPEHRGALLEAAQAGARLRELRERLARLSPPADRTRLDERRVARLGKTLSRLQFLRDLSDAEQREMEGWLNRMPKRLRDALGD